MKKVRKEGVLIEVDKDHDKLRKGKITYDEYCKRRKAILNR